MSMIHNRANLDNLRINFPDNYNKAFEDMITHMFMRKLSISAPLRRTNQKGIEADPVDVNIEKSDEFKSGRYAYQAKYYAPRTELSEKKDDFIKSIKVAHEKGVTDLIFYINKELKENSRIGGVPKYEVEINEAAKRAGICLHWYTRNRIETELDTDEYHYIHDLFLSDKDSHNITGFYQHICNKMTREHPNAIYGSMSLLDSYIEPYICVEKITESVDCHVEVEEEYSETPEVQISSFFDSKERGMLITTEPYHHEVIRKITVQNQTVRHYLESWVSGDDYLTIISGEPGHGKTSLCRKAIYDFYKTGWLENIVENVFLFSLNPAGTGAVISGSLNFPMLLSWGDGFARSKKSNTLCIDECKNSLIFLDGFDELLEWLPGYNLSELLSEVYKFLMSFDEENKPHIVITTRKMALRLSDFKNHPIKELQLITEQQQYEWIARYYKHLDKESTKKDYDPYFSQRETTSRQNNEYLQRYRTMLQNMKPTDELFKLLGVPVIFRMIVVAEFIPQKASHLVTLYNELFSLTWERHGVKVDLKHGKDYIKRKLTRHALKIYADNNESAEVKEKPGEAESSWLYAFYTQYQDYDNMSPYIFRVAFWHKTFLEYFLACEILSWFLHCRIDGKLHFNDKDIIDFEGVLFTLSKRRLSKEVLLSIKTLYEDNINNETTNKIGDWSFKTAYSILKKTDGLLKVSVSPDNKCLPIDSDSKNFFAEVNRKILEDDSLTPLCRGNNVFWNVISICSVCGYKIKKNYINETALLRYDLRGCYLQNAYLEYSNLDKVELGDAHLQSANLMNTELRWANLSNAHLEDAILEGVSLRRANLDGTHFEGANLRYASLSYTRAKEAYFQKAYLEGAWFRDSVFINTYFSVAHLEYTNFEKAILEGSNFVFANLKGAWLRETNFNKTDCSHAYFEGSFLEDATFINANLKGAWFKSTHLVSSNFRDADLENAYFKGATLELGHLEHTNLQEACFQHANLEMAHLENANFKYAKLDSANLYAAYLDEAVFLGSNLKHTYLKGASLKRAQFIESQLNFADFTDACLRGASFTHTCLEGVSFENADLRGAQFSDVILNGANFKNAIVLKKDIASWDTLGIDTSKLWTQEK